MKCVIFILLLLGTTFSRSGFHLKITFSYFADRKSQVDEIMKKSVFSVLKTYSYHQKKLQKGRVKEPLMIILKTTKYYVNGTYCTAILLRTVLLKK